jgi:hypothetical protein
MSDLRNIQISFTSTKEKTVEQTSAATRGSYSIDIQAGEEWVVTGKYCDNSLCALELKRIPRTGAED